MHPVALAETVAPPGAIVASITLLLLEPWAGPWAGSQRRPARGQIGGCS